MPRRKGGRKTRKRVPWAGWGKQQPKGHQRTVMYKKCGSKCFLGPKKRPHPSFPICTKGTCRVNTKGVYAAYVRAKQWGKKRSRYKGKSRPSMRRRAYTRVARKANAILRRTKRGGRRTRRGGTLKTISPTAMMNGGSRKKRGGTGGFGARSQITMTH
mgnify:CR=1 FL=1|jgi:hypothetical protein|tara:strand:- start:114 stop:587 length:474 start_codon:yes stop_codon:yes gene_type:complete